LKNASRRAVGENPVLNTILTTVPDSEFDALRPHLDWQSLPLNTVLEEPARSLGFVYFLNDGFASAVVPTGDGRSVEVAGIGKHGFVGVSLIFGIETSVLRVVVRVPGSAFRISADVMTRLLPMCPELYFMLGKSALLLGMQAAQSAVCNRLHDLQQRLARWLLSTYDGVGPEFAVTQEYLADMLGTGRPSVSLVAGQMQKAGVIQYARGSVKIVDRDALERMACECYGNVQRLRSQIEPASS
jgi:CRP-like cAMP-binding protein